MTGIIILTIVPKADPPIVSSMLIFGIKKARNTTQNTIKTLNIMNFAI